MTTSGSSNDALTSSRRQFLKVSGLAGLGLMSAPVLASCALNAPDGSSPSVGKVITIGATVGLTGPIAAASRQFTGYMQRVFDDANTRDVLGGRTVKLSVVDDGGKGDVALVNARKFIEGDNVFAITTVGSATTAGILSYVQARKTPLLFPGAYNTELSVPSNATTFTLFAPYERQARAMVKWAFAQKGVGTIVLVRANLPTFDAPERAIAEEASASGTKLVKTISTTYGQPEWSSTLIQLKQLDPDYVFLVTSASDSGRLWNEMVLQKYRPKKAILGNSPVADGDFLATAKNVVDDLIFGAVPGTVVPADPAADSVRALWPGEELSVFGLEGALSGAVIVEALRVLGDKTTPEALCSLLDSRFGPFSTPYSTSIASSSDHVMAKSMRVSTVRAGKFASVSNSQFQL